MPSINSSDFSQHKEVSAIKTADTIPIDDIKTSSISEIDGKEKTENKNNSFLRSDVLQFKNFTFRYRAQAAPTLFNINLSVKRGEKILILGPSGSGKSTLVHCINGIIPHAFKGEVNGEISLMGKNSLELDLFAISKLAGTVLQDTDGQFVGLSAAEDIAFALENDCVSAEEMHRRAFDTASLVGMETHLGKSPHDLSGGQKQRVSIAGVLVDNVDILLFDEPLANLDPAAGKEAIELIDDLQKKTGKTIIIVEHRLEDVLHRQVDRIIVIDNGRIIFDGNPPLLLSTDILTQTGIREPLYLSALKYAKVPITEDIQGQHTSTLKCDYKPLIMWYQSISDEKLGMSNTQKLPADSKEKKISLTGDNERLTKNNQNEGLIVKNVRFRYSQKGEEALKGVSFSLKEGECTALVGRNGSGKSTMAKCICGFVKPDSGTIFYRGQNLAELSIMERAEKIGLVMQNPNQMISFPLIYDEVSFGLRTRNVPETEIKERAYEALKTCGLYSFRNWPVNALSYGQKKRLTIASILVLKPQLIILDEPTAGQDYRHYTEFMEFLLSLKEDLSVSLLLITHDMHLMLEYTTRAVVLSEGECVADNEPFEILTDDEVIKKASLKRTSLYELALNAGFSDPKDFVNRYLQFERSKKAEKRQAV